MARRGHYRLVYRGRWWAAALGVVLTAAAITLGVTFGLLMVSMSPVIVMLAWLAYAVRIRPVPAGTGGGGPDTEPGAGVREPRRPLPMSPAGAAERPFPTA